MTGVVLRKLSEAERAKRAAILLGNKREVDLDDIELMAAEFQRVTSSQPMSSAPKDGTHILAYLYREPDDDGYRGFGEWREIFYRPYEAMKGWNTPWHAGDPHDSHTGGQAPEHFGEGVPIAWLPLPANPNKS